MEEQENHQRAETVAKQVIQSAVAKINSHCLSLNNISKYTMFIFKWFISFFSRKSFQLLQKCISDSNQFGPVKLLLVQSDFPESLGVKPSSILSCRSNQLPNESRQGIKRCLGSS